MKAWGVDTKDHTDASIRYNAACQAAGLTPFTPPFVHKTDPVLRDGTNGLEFDGLVFQRILEDIGFAVSDPVFEQSNWASQMAGADSTRQCWYWVQLKDCVEREKQKRRNEAARLAGLPKPAPKPSGIRLIFGRSLWRR